MTSSDQGVPNGQCQHGPGPGVGLSRSPAPSRRQVSGLQALAFPAAPRRRPHRSDSSMATCALRTQEVRKGCTLGCPLPSGTPPSTAVRRAAAWTRPVGLHGPSKDRNHGDRVLDTVLLRASMRARAFCRTAAKLWAARAGRGRAVAGSVVQRGSSSGGRTGPASPQASGSIAPMPRNTGRLNR